MFDAIENPLLTTLSGEWLAVMLDATAKGSAVLLLTGLSVLAMRRLSASSRHFVLLLGVASVLVLPALAAPAGMEDRAAILRACDAIDRERDPARNGSSCAQ